ncbi:MAG: B12-binding domain-containing radical SAM protein [Anaerovoracaceae bacterium]|jgi:radical SAM superfamily enzyme YgiQ (UPF0313 family)
MRYEGDIYRPPSEAYSLLVQVTIGCTNNKCTFCSMFKDKKFRVRDVNEVLEDLEDARRRYAYVERFFLCDGDALCLADKKIMVILDKINELFPERRQINVYGNARDVLSKKPGDLERLHENGVEIIYIGAESGSDKVLKDVKKGVTRDQIVEAVHRIEDAGIKASVTFISGLAGRDGWKEHAVETGKMITELNATYVALLTLILEPSAPMYQDVKDGKFQLLRPDEVLKETHLLLEHANPEKSCIFRSNHASNYLNLRGNLPEDRDAMLRQIEMAMEHQDMLKGEIFRAL